MHAFVKNFGDRRTLPYRADGIEVATGTAPHHFLADEFQFKWGTLAEVFYNIKK
jgi:hypothetical protein